MGMPQSSSVFDAAGVNPCPHDPVLSTTGLTRGISFLGFFSSAGNFDSGKTVLGSCVRDSDELPNVGKESDERDAAGWSKYVGL